MRVIPVSFVISVLVNSALLFSVDHAVRVEQAGIVKELERVKKQETKDLQFEFVEAPPKTHPQKPERARKISDRDALNQDLTGEKAKAQMLPKTKRVGSADQLEQKRKIADGGSRMAEKKPEAKREKQGKGVIASEPHHLQMVGEAKKSDAKRRREQPKAARRSGFASSLRSSQPASPPRNDSVGQDKITTQEMSRTASVAAKFYGLTSFEATGSGMGEYMKKLKEKIWLAWFPYIAFKYPLDFKGADAVIGFTLNREGEVKIIQILESSGSPLFATFCTEALQRAGNFGKLPEEILALIGKDELEIRFAFHYR